MGTPFDFILNKAPTFLLIVARVAGLVFTAPLLSTRAVSRIVKIALAGFIAFLCLSYYPVNHYVEIFNFHYLLLLLGEVLIGILTGFYVLMIFSTFSTAGQFFTYQMGFGASEVYDALSQVENPLMGQYFNFIAVVIFLQIKGFQRLFFTGIVESITKVNCFVFLESEKPILNLLFKSMATLFLNAIIMSMPIMGTLILIHVTMGLLTKAAPQMNLLSEGFPITILVTFFLLTIMFPFLINTFDEILKSGFNSLHYLFMELGMNK
ncbi:MAG: flagellar biosynthetic protein FliR [Treponema sp.]